MTTVQFNKICSAYNMLAMYSLVSLITVTVVTGQCVHTLVTALMDLDFSAFVNVAMQRFIRLICTVGHFVAHQMIVNALSIGTCKLSGGACAVLLLCTAHLIRTIAAVVFAITTIL